MTSSPELAQFGLRRRLLVLILIPLAMVGAINAWGDVQLAGSASRLQDEQMVRLMPLLANAVLSTPPQQGLSDSVVMLAPDLQSFLLSRGKLAAFRVSRPDGARLAGDARISPVLPLAHDVELHTELRGGTSWRVTAQRLQLADGQEVVLQIADGSDARQRWLRTMLQRVLLPNLLMALAVYFAVRWAVKRALAPLVELQRSVERREPKDLSPIDTQGTPQEVSPLIAALNRLFANAKQQGDAQRRFVADAAHQLRTPLAALHIEVQAAAAHSSQADGAVHLPSSTLHRMEQATRRAATLAHQLLTLSRAEAEAAAPPLEPVRVGDLLQEVLVLRLDAALACQADLGMELPTELAGAEILVQPWMLRELLLNLIDNALRYSPAPAVITLGAQAAGEPSDRSLSLFVADNGPGIAPSERALVLERFYRAAGNAVDGNGLGLAIAQEIAQRHGSSLVLRDASPLPASSHNPATQGHGPGLWVGLKLPLRSEGDPGA